MTGEFVKSVLEFCRALVEEVVHGRVQGVQAGWGPMAQLNGQATSYKERLSQVANSIPARLWCDGIGLRGSIFVAHSKSHEVFCDRFIFSIFLVTAWILRSSIPGFPRFMVWCRFCCGCLLQTHDCSNAIRSTPKSF